MFQATVSHVSFPPPCLHSVNREICQTYLSFNLCLCSKLEGKKCRVLFPLGGEVDVRSPFVDLFFEGPCHFCHSDVFFNCWRLKAPLSWQRLTSSAVSHWSSVQHSPYGECFCLQEAHLTHRWAATPGNPDLAPKSLTL